MIVFCDAEFLNTLTRAFPDVTVLPYSTIMEHCQSQLEDISTQPGHDAVILFKGRGTGLDNQEVSDHLNLSRDNPLIGPANLDVGPRFPDMSSVYEGQNGALVVFGEDEDLRSFDEPFVSVTGGVWEAIALKHRRFRINGWIIADIEKWISETSIFN